MNKWSFDPAKIIREMIDVLMQNKNKTSIFAEHVIPSKPGTYLILSADNIVLYVGETNNLKNRFNELKHTPKHTFRRKLACNYFCDHKDYEKYIKGKKYSNSIEMLIDKKLSELHISYIVTELGRKELEETLIQQYKDTCLNS